MHCIAPECHSYLHTNHMTGKETRTTTTRTHTITSPQVSPSVLEEETKHNITQQNKTSRQLNGERKASHITSPGTHHIIGHTSLPLEKPGRRAPLRKTPNPQSNTPLDTTRAPSPCAPRGQQPRHTKQLPPTKPCAQCVNVCNHFGCSGKPMATLTLSSSKQSVRHPARQGPQRHGAASAPE